MIKEEAEVKTLESIREEIWEEMLRLEDKRKDQWADIRYQTLREVLQKLGHLDEPEVLSQEFINEKAVEVYADTADAEVHAVFRIRDLQNLLVPKQKLPVIPKFVADILEENTFADLPTAFEELFSANAGRYYGEDICNWVVTNDELFARAWLDGYEVVEEREQKYYVLNNEGEAMIRKDDSGVRTSSGFKIDTRLTYEGYKLTEQEIKDYDERYWPFAVKVEELEEC